MRIIILIAIKDIKQIIRDRNALILMLLAPFLLTVVIGFTTGSLGRSSPGGSGSIQISPTARVQGLVDPDQTTSLSSQVAAAQLISHGLAPAAKAAQLVSETPPDDTSAILLDNITVNSQAPRFDLMAYLAPAMAVMFLMYTVSNGGRILLAEHDQGTLMRLLTSPTSTFQLLVGKVLGIMLIGAAQLMLLINASTYLFHFQWGDLQAVLILSFALAFGASGWGLLLAALAHSADEASRIGIILTLVFGLFGGSFFYLGNMPTWFQTASKITPNAWGMQAFTTLISGGTLTDVQTPVFALLAMGAILLTISVFLFNRRDFAQF